MAVPETAMVLAAGHGKRMRPLSADDAEAAGQGRRPRADRPLPRRARRGGRRARGRQRPPPRRSASRRISPHRDAPKIVISDERDELLETGGGMQEALPLLGGEPFLLRNSDSFWLEGVRAESRLAGRRLGRDPHGRAAAPRLDRALRRLFRPRRFPPRQGRPADPPARADGRAFRLCRRGDPRIRASSPTRRRARSR